MRAYLGVDGGGTKTAASVVTGEGELLAAAEGPGCYYLDHPERGIGLVEEVLAGVVREVCAQAAVEPAELTFAFLGLPAHGEVSRDVPVLDAVPRAVLGHDRYRVDNDTVCGWAGSLAGGDGINVVAGTGSITYGRRGEVGVRVGGWSEVFGDEGSGHWLGIRALRVFSRMSDGREPAGPLLDVFREHLGLETDLDLVDVVVNRWQGSRPRIAALSRPLVVAARRGDPAARRLLAEAGAELAELVEATRRRLRHDPADVVAVSYSGGVFSVPEVLAEFRARLPAEGYDLRTPRFTPAIGAALHAARLDGNPLAEEALRRLASRGPAVVGTP